MNKRKTAKISSVTAVAIAAALLLTAVALCAVFPNKYAKELSDAAREFDLPAPLVRSVVWAESKFDSRALSKKGARGLMQLMPETFEMCADDLGLGERDAFDPKTSLRCGCYYLSLMLKRFDGDMTAALAAYNAGEANARKFLDGEPMFPETQKYLKDIAFAARFYGFFG